MRSKRAKENDDSKDLQCSKRHFVRPFNERRSLQAECGRVIYNEKLMEIRMPVIGFDHVQLAMPSGKENEGRLFFGDILGLPELPKPADLGARGGLWFQCGAMQLHLGVQKDFSPATKAHPGLLVDHLEPLIAALQTAGYPVLNDVPIVGFSRVFTQDPFGNRIELLEQIKQVSM